MTPILLALAYLACGIVTRAVLIRMDMAKESDSLRLAVVDVAIWWIYALTALAVFALALASLTSRWLANRHPLRAIGAWWHAAQTKRARDQFMPRLGRRDGE